MSLVKDKDFKELWNHETHRFQDKIGQIFMQTEALYNGEELFIEYKERR